MYTKVMTFTDFNDNERTETFRFNLTKAELADLELSMDGGLENYLKKIVDAKDTKSLVDVFKKIILMSYGIKSEDGLRFEKSPEISKAFSETQAYSDLYMELAQNDVLAADFVNNILPKDMRGSATAAISENVKK